MNASSTTTAPSQQAIVPRATYRLQLHSEFDFDAARARLPYLQRLGISHVYCSPIGTARPGSRHGYDVVDPSRINPELGGEAGFERFAQEARALGLGLLIDVVPNHMGVFGSANPWWLDVLENGPASEYARCFDIDWNSPNPSLRGKLLVPLLGDHVGAVLERGELRLDFEPELGRLSLRYHDHRCPIDPSTYPQVLRRGAADDARAALDALGALGALGALDALAEAFAALPSRDSTDVAAVDLRRSAARALQQRLAERVAQDAAARAAIDAALRSFNEEPNRDGLDALHAAQAYRLAYWRIASGEINYRRFFDINDLAAVRVEDERVFEATQGPALDLAARGIVDGLRIDHSDGLHDPAQYFDRLQRGHRRRAGLAEPADGALSLYVVTEKIAAGYEEVPPRWALQGTTGYRFAMLLNGLFVERRSAAAMQRLWREVEPSARDFETLKFECKRAVATGALRSELNVLGAALQRIALRDRHTRDYSLADLTDALADVAAAMPVYRTYVDEHGASAQDLRFIEWAIGQARVRSSLADPAIFDFVQRCVSGGEGGGGVGDGGERADDAERAQALRTFAMRFQQFCAPVAAKGVEDTAFYRDHRLVALNEVGADPGVFGISARAFHAANADRAKRWPHTMLATSTHDNKRAEDVRWRIDVLSERPGAWRLEWRRWQRLTRPLLLAPSGEREPTLPSAADRYLLLQTLVGTLRTDAADDPDYPERIQAYMLKAIREAKLHTSWNRPDTAYESAVHAYVQALLGDGRSAPLAYLRPRVAALAWFGALNSLSATVLKLTVPGVPDTYQGTELFDFSLVDPDNRRPVDWERREALLTQFEALDAGDDGGAVAAAVIEMRDALARGDDGRLKLWLIRRLLHARRADPALFAQGGYTALPVLGPRRTGAVAFMRRHAGRTLLVIAGRKFASAGLDPQAPWDGSPWTGTRIAWPAALKGDVRGRDLLGGAPPPAFGEAIDLGQALHALPVAAWLFGDGG